MEKYCKHWAAPNWGDWNTIAAILEFTQLRHNIGEYEILRPQFKNTAFVTKNIYFSKFCLCDLTNQWDYDWVLLGVWKEALLEEGDQTFLDTSSLTWTCEEEELEEQHLEKPHMF